MICCLSSLQCPPPYLSWNWRFLSGFLFSRAPDFNHAVTGTENETTIERALTRLAPIVPIGFVCLTELMLPIQARWSEAMLSSRLWAADDNGGARLESLEHQRELIEGI